HSIKILRLYQDAISSIPNQIRHSTYARANNRQSASPHLNDRNGHVLNAIGVEMDIVPIGYSWNFLLRYHTDEIDVTKVQITKKSQAENRVLYGTAGHC